MRTPTEIMLKKPIIWGIFLVPFIALIIVPTMYYPFLTPQGFAFRILTEILFGMWLMRALFFWKHLPKRLWIVIAFGLYLLVSMIANLQGLNTYFSFFGDYAHMDGWFNLLHVFLYLIIISTTLQNRKEWDSLFQISLGISALVSIYALLQLAGFIELVTGRLHWGIRVGGTIGNPSYLAIYLLFHIFIAFFLCINGFKEYSKRKRMFFLALYGAVVILDTTVLLLAGTRGTTLGLGIGTLITLVLLSVQKTTVRARLFAICGVIFLISLFSCIYLARDTSLVRNADFLNRFVTVSLQDSSVRSRLEFYSIAIQGVKERPVLGWGQENYSAVYYKHLGEKTKSGEEWPDRPHSVPLQILIDSGILGLLAYLSIFGVTLLVLWRNHNFSNVERATFTGLLCAYFIHNLFIFDVVQSYIFFATTLGYITYKSIEGTEQPLKQHVSGEAVMYVGSVVLVLSIFLAWWINYPAIRANYLLQQGLTHQPGGLQVNLRYFKDAISSNTFGTNEAVEELAKAAIWVSAQNADIITKKDFYETAKAQLEQQVEKYPESTPTLLYLGQLDMVYGNFTDANSAYNRTLSLSPNNPFIINLIAENKARQGDLSGGLSDAKKAYEMNPDSARFQLTYALLAIYSKDFSTADELLALPANENALTDLILKAYFDVRRPDKVIAIILPYLQAHSDDTKRYRPLIGAYYLTGNIPQAIKYTRILEGIDPSIGTRAEALITAMSKSSPETEILTQIDQLMQ